MAVGFPRVVKVTTRSITPPKSTQLLAQIIQIAHATGIQHLLASHLFEQGLGRHCSSARSAKNDGRSSTILLAEHLDFFFEARITSLWCAAMLNGGTTKWLLRCLFDGAHVEKEPPALRCCCLNIVFGCQSEAGLPCFIGRYSTHVVCNTLSRNLSKSGSKKLAQP